MAPTTNHGSLLLSIDWILLFCSLVVISFRMYIRLGYLKARPTLADWFMLAALACGIIASCFSTVDVHYGLGRHEKSLSAHDAALAIEYQYILTIFNLLAPMFGRLSFAVYILALLPKHAKYKKLSLHVVNVVQVTSVVLTLIQLWAECGTHVSILWGDPGVWDKYCSPRNVAGVIGYVTASLYAVCDLWLTLLPLEITRKLNMAPSLKRALASVLCLSGLAFIGSVTRTCLLTYLSRPDRTWYIIYLDLCVSVESNIVMICASMPVMRVLWKNDGMIRSSPRNTTGQTSNTTDSYDLENHGGGGGAKNRSTSRRIRHLSQTLPKPSLRQKRTSFAASEDAILDGGNKEGGGDDGAQQQQDISKTRSFQISYALPGEAESLETVRHDRSTHKEWE